MEAAGQEQIPILTEASVEVASERISLLRKNASCLNKVGSALQARRPGKNPLLLPTILLSTQKSFKRFDWKCQIKIQSKKRRDEKSSSGRLRFDIY